MTENCTVIISGIESEQLALDLTKWLLNEQAKRQDLKRHWRSLQFRPFVLTADQAQALLTDAKPVILHNDRLATIGPAHQLEDQRPTLKRVDRRQRPGPQAQHNRRPA